jgi:hypothetical protein
VTGFIYRAPRSTVPGWPTLTRPSNFIGSFSSELTDTRHHGRYTRAGTRACSETSPFVAPCPLGAESPNPLTWELIANANRRESHWQIFDWEYCCQRRDARLRFTLAAPRTVFRLSARSCQNSFASDSINRTFPDTRQRRGVFAGLARRFSSSGAPWRSMAPEMGARSSGRFHRG